MLTGTLSPGLGVFDSPRLTAMLATTKTEVSRRRGRPIERGDFSTMGLPRTADRPQCRNRAARRTLVPVLDRRAAPSLSARNLPCQTRVVRRRVRRSGRDGTELAVQSVHHRQSGLGCAPKEAVRGSNAHDGYFTATCQRNDADASTAWRERSPLVLAIGLAEVAGLVDRVGLGEAAGLRVVPPDPHLVEAE